MQQRLKMLLAQQDDFPSPLLRAPAADALDALGWLPPDLYPPLPADRPRSSSYPSSTIPPTAYVLPESIPVTNAQYARFLQAEDFADRALWVDFPKYDEHSRG